MSSLAATSPLVFEPLFMERVWGGRRLETLYGKRLPPVVAIGESWEIVDRAEAQSVVAAGPLRGRTLHELWETSRAEIFGDVPEAPRFPLLLKILDAQEKLSVQVHPPADVAKELGGEPKTEFWFVADATPDAELYVGLTRGSSRAAFENAVARGTVDEQLHCVKVRAGDGMFLPSGRVHAIGAGNLIIEIQQNSDTTFRVFDWNRLERGAPRKLHVDESLRCINFADIEPSLSEPAGSTLIADTSFRVDKWHLDSARPLELHERFAIIVCVSGEMEIDGIQRRPGEFCLVPPMSGSPLVIPTAAEACALQITIPRA